jgi:hypothetical protein
MSIKAIETRYKGYRFRSRLEARWAVFFDAAGIKWQYETEGFETPFGRYLPDFYLPDIRGGLWVEVKPPHGKHQAEELGKICSVVEHTEKPAIFVRGIPDVGLDPYKDFQGAGDWSAWAIIKNGGDGVGASDCPYIFCVCPWCGKIGLEFDGRGARVCNFSSPCSKNKKDRDEDKAYSYDHPLLAAAYSAARSARFEHGEAPK